MTSTNIQLLKRNDVDNWQEVGFFILTYKTKHNTGGSFLLRDRKKSQLKYIVSKGLPWLETIISPIINIRGFEIRMPSVEKNQKLN